MVELSKLALFLLCNTAKENITQNPIESGFFQELYTYVLCVILLR